MINIEKYENENSLYALYKIGSTEHDEQGEKKSSVSYDKAGETIQKSFVAMNNNDIHDFRDSNILNEKVRKICEILNYEQATEIQKLILENIYDDTRTRKMSDYILKCRAGSGKTFAFILAMLKNFDFDLKKLQSIVILPTRELCLQTAEYFEKINNYKNSNTDNKAFEIKYQIMIGGHQDINEDRKNLSKKPNIKNDTQILIGTIGKLNLLFSKDKNKNKNNVKNLLQAYSALQIVVLDEADKLIFQNKNNNLKNFLVKLTEIKNLMNLKDSAGNTYGIEKTNESIAYFLVSASLDENTKKFYSDILKRSFEVLEPNLLIETKTDKFLGNIDIRKEYTSKVSVIMDEASYPQSEKLKTLHLLSNIKEYYYVFKQEERTTYFENKYMKLIFILDNIKDKFKQALIFYNQKGKGEELASDLRDHGWTATTFIHGDLTQDQRVLIYQKIKNLQIKLIISTDLFARGIDLRTVDLLINFDCPYNRVEYYHRVGRTGRYNTLGNAITFFQENQAILLQEIIKDEANKLIKVNFIDNEFIELLKNDYVKIKEKNIFDQDTNTKINKINEALVNIKLPDNEEDDKFLKNKRRKVQYEKESLASEWVDINEKLYDEENFQYLDKINNIVCNIEKDNNSEIHEKEDYKKENEKKESKMITLLTEEFSKHERSCENKVNDDFCLYCDIFKLFDQGEKSKLKRNKQKKL